MERINQLLQKLSNDVQVAKSMKCQDDLDSQYCEGYSEGLKYAIDKIKEMNIYLDLDIKK